jgi:hypothetical protein
MRSVLDMIAGRDAPTANGHNGAGRLLVDLDSHQCRFPLHGDGAGTRFCAAEVSDADWLPGFAGRCYCTFHRSSVSVPFQRSQCQRRATASFS